MANIVIEPINRETIDKKIEQLLQFATTDKERKKLQELKEKSCKQLKI